MKYRYDLFNHNEFESHKLSYNLISDASKVLDIGCATGYFARELLKKNVKLWGVDYDAEAIKKAEKYYEKTLVCDLNEAKNLPFPKKYFDFVIILDVIEHLLYPQNILRIIKPHLKKGGSVIISVPNIAHASIRWMLLRGDFKYTSTGILDNTHVRFYTKESISELLSGAGYRVLNQLPTNGMCKVPFIYKITDRLPPSWQYYLVKKFPSLCAFQFITVAKPVSRSLKH